VARLPVHAWKRALLFGGGVVVAYLLIFHWIEHRRVSRGPWVVRFAAEGEAARLTIEQATLGISNVQLRVRAPGLWTNAPAEVRFDQARNVPYAVPFGQCVFQDTLFQPGTVVLRIGAHEIQLLPRVLTLDKVERPWRSGEVIQLD
jgi:hypothetical protein